MTLIPAVLLLVAGLYVGAPLVLLLPVCAFCALLGAFQGIGDRQLTKELS